jgi:hypothetical protein
MKQLILLALLFIGEAFLSDAYGSVTQSIPMQIIDTKPMGSGNTRIPPRPWYITQDDYVLTLPAFDYAYTLVLLDEDGVVVYSADYSAGTTAAVLPSTLSGEFELRLVPYAATYYYRGYIELW